MFQGSHFHLTLVLNMFNPTRVYGGVVCRSPHGVLLCARGRRYTGTAIITIFRNYTATCFYIVIVIFFINTHPGFTNIAISVNVTNLLRWSLPDFNYLIMLSIRRRLH